MVPSTSHDQNGGRVIEWQSSPERARMRWQPHPSAGGSDHPGWSVPGLVPLRPRVGDELTPWAIQAVACFRDTVRGCSDLR
jgi:hypothetical protein